MSDMPETSEGLAPGQSRIEGPSTIARGGGGLDDITVHPTVEHPLVRQRALDAIQAELNDSADERASVRAQEARAAKARAEARDAVWNAEKPTKRGFAKTGLAGGLNDFLEAVGIGPRIRRG